MRGTYSLRIWMEMYNPSLLAQQNKILMIPSEMMSAVM